MTNSILPDILPLHPKSQPKLFALSIDDHDIDLSNFAGQEILNTINQIIDFSNIDDLKVNDLIHSLEKSQKTVLEQNEVLVKAKERLNDARNIYNRESVEFLKNNPNWHDNIETGNKMSTTLSTLYNDSTTSTNSTPAANKAAEKNKQTDKINELLRVLPYIMKDPTAVIPDMNDGESDELEIEGGNIELICPITFKPYQKPMISKQCGHVFDYDGLKDYFRNEESRLRDCPQAACGKKLTLKEFELDDMMVLRCKLAKLKERKQQNTKNEEVLDVL